MKKSKYAYFFDIDDEYVGYSYLTDKYVAFPKDHKDKVLFLLDNPDHVLTNLDAEIYTKLSDSKCLIREDFDEYAFLMYLHRKFIHRTDRLALTIAPTMACNCRCPYCYEVHPSLKTSMMSREVIDNLKKYIAGNIKKISTMSIGWFGGEPLLCINIIKEISEFCIDLCNKENVLYLSGMTSNGVLLNQRNSQILSDCRIHYVQITIDGSRENHDKTRLTVNGNPTFDLIYSNIIHYLETHEKNMILLRIHVSSNIKEEEIVEIIETLKLFEIKYRQRIVAYTHVISTACSENWASKCRAETCLTEKIFDKMNATREREIDITSRIQKAAVELGYSINLSDARDPNISACPGDADWFWIVRPEGLLSKCSVGIEKERAQARLTDNGIELFPERFSKMVIKKEYSGILYEHCRNCEQLPFCWQGCFYKHYQNPDINDYIETNCEKKSWMLEKMLNRLKYHYTRQ